MSIGPTTISDRSFFIRRKGTVKGRQSGHALDIHTPSHYLPLLPTPSTTYLPHLTTPTHSVNRHGVPIATSDNTTGVEVANVTAEGENVKAVYPEDLDLPGCIQVVPTPHTDQSTT